MAERFSLAEKNVRFSGKARKGDPRRWRADITALKNLGFSPETGFKTGIRQYRQWIDTAVR
jgi:dTDP-glucose 4,6-dehydratase/UDP-glucose 4-epimerase